MKTTLANVILLTFVSLVPELAIAADTMPSGTIFSYIFVDDAPYVMGGLGPDGAFSLGPYLGAILVVIVLSYAIYRLAKAVGVSEKGAREVAVTSGLAGLGVIGLGLAAGAAVGWPFLIGVAIVVLAVAALYFLVRWLSSLVGATPEQAEKAGNVASSAAAGAVVGAAIGSAIPVVGTVVGAAVGAVVGAVGALLDWW